MYKISTILFLALSANLFAQTTINIPADYSTIQAGLNAASTGDTVLVAPGTYYENIIWPETNSIKLIGQDTSNTIIDGLKLDRVIKMEREEGSPIDSITLIQGFKITGGATPSDGGGGIYMKYASPKLNFLSIIQNSAIECNGGGLYLYYSNPMLTDVSIYSNSAASGDPNNGRGGGLYLYYSSPMLTDVSVYSNSASSIGGGLCLYISSPILTDVSIYSNIASFNGGGLYLFSSSPTLTNVSIYSNYSPTRGGGLYLLSSSPTLTNVSIYSNSTAYESGGLYLYNSSPILTDVSIYSNSASRCGGLYLLNSSPRMTNVMVFSNSAENSGGGIYCKNSTINNGLTVADNFSIYGGGIYIEDNNTTLKKINIINNYSTSLNEYNGIYSKYGGEIDSCNIINNNYSVFHERTDFYMHANNNWFGDASGPYQELFNPNGKGDSVSSYVNIRSWLTEPNIEAPPIPARNLEITISSNSSISFKWLKSKMSDFASFKVYYDTDSSGYPYSNFIDIGIDTTYTLTGLTEGTEYYIAVTTTDTDNNESWYSQEVSAIAFSAPEKTELLTPITISIGNIQPITFKWNSTKYSDNYDFQVASDSLFSNLIVDKTNYTDTSFVYANFNELTTYYWRVRGINNYANGNWSETWNFKTIGRPTDVNLLLPLANSENQPIELDFVWSKAKDQLKPIKRNNVLSINNYWFELNSDTNSSSVLIDSTLIDTTKHLGGLANLTEYYWRVRAKNETGWGGFSNWSKFTTIIDTPSLVNLITPLNNSNGLLTSLVLTWNKSDFAESYSFHVSTDSTFATTIIDSSELADTSFVLNKLNILTKYYWRVKAKNIGGLSDWSEIWRFKTLGNPKDVIPVNPLSNSTNQPTEIEFIWNKAKELLIAIKGNRTLTINNYWFELYTDTTNSSIIVDSTLSDTTKHVNNLEHLTTYYWRVRAKNEIGWGAYSNWSMFTTIVDTPNVVALQSPLNNSVGNIQPILITWFNSKRTDSYRLQVSTDESFTTMIVDSSLVVDTFYTLQQLNRLTTYFWRLNSKNIGGISEWSVTWKFKTLGQPTVVKPLLPLNNSIDQPLEINFVWSKAKDQLQAIKGNDILSISNYWFELNTDTSNVAFVVDSTLTDTTKQISNLENLTEYYWRVRAKNETGWGVFSSWSKFKTIIDIPNVVVLQSPFNSSNKVIKPINLIWNKSTLAENYSLQLSVNAEFSSNLIDSTGISDTSLIVNNLDDLTKYYWRIKANNNGGESNWSEIWNFTTLGVPNAPTLVLPENDVELSDTTNNIEFVWNNVESVESYTIEASTNDSFDSLFVDIADLIDTTYTYLNQLIAGKFYWRVKAKNQIGFSDYSDIYSFTITLTDIDRLGNEVPQDFVLEQNYPNPFNPSTMVKYGLPEQSNIKIEVFNMLGQSVGVLVNSEKQSGFYETVWNAENLPSGIYLISIRAEGLSSKKNFTQVKKALLLK